MICSPFKGYLKWISKLSWGGKGAFKSYEIHEFLNDIISYPRTVQMAYEMLSSLYP